MLNLVVFVEFFQIEGAIAEIFAHKAGDILR